MTLEIFAVLTITILTVVLFATERFPVDQVALMVMALLLLTGLVTPQDGLAGFSNTATVTVAAMFVLSSGLFKSGAVNFIGGLLGKTLHFNPYIALLSLMVAVAAMSAVMNNTPVVAIFIPIVLGASRVLKYSASKLLMPLSFASMFGGVCTLIGTSTNILVSSVNERYGEEPFSMFEFTPLGLVFFAAGTAYMLLIGLRLIPKRRGQEDLADSFGMGEYLTEIVLEKDSDSVGERLGETPLEKELKLDVLELIRDEERTLHPRHGLLLRAGDILRVRCEVEKIRELQERKGISLHAERHLTAKDLESDEVIVVEAVIAPNSSMEGKSLQQLRFRHRFGATALAIRHHGALRRMNVEAAPLHGGDTLLLQLHRDYLDRFQEHPAFLIVSELGEMSFRKGKILPAVAILAGVILTAALGILPIVTSSIVGCGLMVLLRCLSIEEAYDAIDLKVIFLLAGMLTLGIALEKSGAALLLARLLGSTVGGWGPIALVAAFYLLTSLLTEAMSNNATAALLAPIAIATAESLGINSRPLLMAVTFAASSSFMTPVGYQTNAMIYGPGQYRFTDFLRVGAPLNFLFWILATLLIPHFWPF